MIFNMVNIGGGELQCIMGSFSSPSNKESQSFTVSGVTFEPKIIAIRRASSAYAGTNDAEIIDVLFFDVENSRVFWFYSNHGRDYTGSMGQCNNGSGTVTKNGSSVTIAFSGFGGYFSQWDMWNEHVMYGSYEYYIYG